MARKIDETLLAAMLLGLSRDHKLNDEFLPPDEFQVVTQQPILEWPPALHQKLAPWCGQWLAAAKRHQAGQASPEPK